MDVVIIFTQPSKFNCPSLQIVHFLIFSSKKNGKFGNIGYKCDNSCDSSVDR